ncbi:MAG: hypothetical protein JO318_08290 [Chloroflexi bacterium]|nr:hypothetical protein [Chloroflexota bacterium]
MAKRPASNSANSAMGTPSADVFRLVHGRAIIGEYWPEKAGDGHPGRILYASSIDRALGRWLEFHPLVACYQRADLREDQVRAWRLRAPFGPSLPIAYHFDGRELFHFPDYQGRWIDGTPFVADAGSFESQLSGRVLAAAEATRLAMRIAGGRYFVGTETTIAPRLHRNLINLHARRRHHDLNQFELLANQIRSQWIEGGARSIRQVCAAPASGTWAEGEMLAAAWKIVADTAASGRLLIIGGLDGVELDLDRSLELLSPDVPPIGPESLPDSPQPTPPTPYAVRDVIEADARGIPGPTIDESELATLPRSRSLSAEQRDELLATVRRNRAITEAWQCGASYREVAAQFHLQPSQAHYLIRRVLKYGQRAWIPHAVYQSPRLSNLHPALQECIRSQYSRAIRLGSTAVWESAELERVWKSLNLPEPSYWQVYRYCKHLERTDSAVRAKRSGLRGIPRGLTSVESLISSVKVPGLICQVDEHLWDGRFVGHNGTIIRGRIHIGVLVCVATGAILGAVTSAHALSEWDYMRLLKQAMEPKDQLKMIHGFVNDWDVVAKPQLILSDRGSIFVSQHAMEVVRPVRHFRRPCAAAGS